MPEGSPPIAVAEVLAAISPARLRADIDALAGFGTRHTLSADAPDRGIAAARRYIVAQLEAAIQLDRPASTTPASTTPTSTTPASITPAPTTPGSPRPGSPRSGSPRSGSPLTVEEEPFELRPDGRRIDRAATLINVVATLPGTMPEATSRRIYVLGHYDSRATDVMDPEAPAPGANDDGSGVALTIELARVLAGQPLDATVVFMATAGEEQGLLGARRHAAAARARDVTITGVLSNDIVGDPRGPDGQRHDRHVRVFSSGVSLALDGEALARRRARGALADGSSRQLARYVATIAAWERTPVQPTLVLRPDRFLRGGDHLAFDEQGYPAVRLTEVAEDYDRQHQDPRTEDGRRYGDHPEYVDEHYLAQVTQLNGSVLVHLANAPSAPANAVVLATALTTDTTLRWSPSPEPDVAGYEVVWRSTLAPAWQHVRNAGTKTEITLSHHKDDWIFGVRAYDRDGYRSPVNPCGIVRS
ncbi:MAG: M28 family peptidase [Myxococcota bacterium]